MKITTVSKINIRKLIIPIIFGTNDISDETLNEVKKELRNIEVLITEMLDQGMSPFAMSIEDLAEMTGGASAKQIRRDLTRVMKIAHDKSGVTFEKPPVIEPERMFYILSAYILGECGRVSDDPAEWTVRFNMQDLFDMGALDSANDMVCWAFLIEYFEDCLMRGRMPITNYIKNYANSKVSARRLMTYLKKNYWYGDIEESSNLFMLSTATPSLSSIVNAALERFEKIYEEKKEEKEWLEVDKAQMKK